MTPQDVVAQALHDVWQPVDDQEQFPSRDSQARFLLDALAEAGWAVVAAPRLHQLLERLSARNRGRPSWSDDHDLLTASAARILSDLLEEACPSIQVSDTP
jgi:hypothetical protein